MTAWLIYLGLLLLGGALIDVVLPSGRSRWAFQTWYWTMWLITTFVWDRKHLLP